MGVAGPNASRQRRAYTVVARSGRRPAAAARRVGVVGAPPLVRGVVVHHRVHRARGDPDEEPRPPHARDVRGAPPVRLRDDPDPVALRLEHPADHRRAEARVVHVGVARHEQDVERVPAARAHLGAGGRQEGARRGAGVVRDAAIGARM